AHGSGCDGVFSDPDRTCGRDRHAGGDLGHADIQVACERRVPALPVLTCPKVRSVPVLGIHHSRLGLT
ncbi:MAG: hypothetical protein EOS57_30215, partial [Mesorhizobium sp.]